MKVIEKIDIRLQELNPQNPEKYKVYYALWEEVKSVIAASNQHLKQIISQLHNFDAHDESHSEKVLDNIELLLGEAGLENLSLYELILLYASAFLHDGAMALPQWEYEMLTAVEGTPTSHDSRLKIKILNDLKPPQSLAEIMHIIERHKLDIYGDFKTTSQFIFAFKDESKFCLDLAERVQHYEQFRSRYTDKFNVLQNDTVKYLNYCELVRSEYIRTTHHTRIETYILVLKNQLAGKIGITAAEQMVRDLSQICRSHGEPFKFVQNLNYKSTIFHDDHGNLQFVALMLRLGDVIHFSSDRAPLSLFAEKKITDPESLKHWNAKFQDLTYTIKNEIGKMIISFSAYCDTPQIYYFIQSYIDWIDQELNNYYSFLNNLEFLKYDKVDIYKLSLGQHVNRDDIIPNRDVFIPEKDLKFTLEQAKILSLLMGVQLYKDKYLCLRELYQNSMDACKCMGAQNQIRSVKEDFFVEFGLKECIIDGVAQKYIYCFDNGTGMTKEIVRNYLLKIGNSYYTSKEFIQQNTNWNRDVKPTSQFGIGILSCYMIASRLEITTKYYENGADVFSFALDGANEHFYYINPNKLDAERIGSHGTMIKLFLNDACAKEINNYFPSKVHYIIHGRNVISNINQEKKQALSALENSLFYLVNRQVGLPKDSIGVRIYDEKNMPHSIIPWNEIFDHRKYPEISSNDIETLWQEYHYLDGGQNPYKDVIKCRDFIEDIPIVVKNENVELHSHISLPCFGIPDQNVKIFDFQEYIWHSEGRTFVDGINVSNKSISLLEKAIGRDIEANSMVNFIGDLRPILSIDRNSIITISEELLNNCSELLPLFIDELVAKINEHIMTNQIPCNSSEATLIIDIVVRKFPTIAAEFINRLAQTEAKEIVLSDIKNADAPRKIGMLIEEKTIYLNNLDMRKHAEITRQLFIGKVLAAISIDVSNSDVKIISEQFQPLSSFKKHYHGEETLTMSSVAIRADKWEGLYQEYDLATQLWPIISPVLFDNLRDDYEIEEMTTQRSKTVPNYSNSITGIAQLDPVLINPKFGISSKNASESRYKKCYVGECENIQNSYWLGDINNHGELPRKHKRDYVLFVFVAPRYLNEVERARLSDFETTDPIYVKGVKEGWSILFIGHAKKYIILPGLTKRADIINEVPDSIKSHKIDDIEYYNLDGTRAF